MPGEGRLSAGTDAVRYATAARLADHIAPRRPENDPSLEQFLMQSGSLAYQGATVGRIFEGRSVLFLGDDDHVSVIAAAFFDLAVIVYEVDPRVADSLRGWASRLSLRNYRVVVSDIRSIEREAGQPAEAFYINPPFSSKNGGHGLRYWVSKALQLCTPTCEGIVVMPANEDLDWVNHNWVSVQRFVSDNGCRILSVGEDQLQTYDGTNDEGMRSQNLHIRRIDPSRVLEEPMRGGENLYR